ncbi:PREDICTED: uncharacterized protein At4g14450, chloroplastic-like [Camelina sativa]|uniref:Uncharacterized protein At4g14450, chloroplastic-like n=1 Tax=Camelina sativa TaxID=90675 RepID=A0ABM0V320_CAMSA|nr:PREDICTED: uncharacterized protein At4g14450, chloroplastic-like [Camelina sativa]
MASKMQRTTSCTTGNEQQRSQLQRRGPSLMIKPASFSNWNVVIPLLSPVAPSPTSSFNDQSHVPPPPQNKTEKQGEEEVKKTPVFKKWKHPASPVSYEPTTFVLPFISV